MTEIKFGTDGWRAILDDQFTNENVQRVTVGVIEYLKNRFSAPKVVVGFDCRRGGKGFSDLVCKILDFHGVEVIIYDQPITTPAISFAAKELKCSLGIILTASHNAPNYNGYKLKGGYGGPLLSDGIKEVESLIPEQVQFKLEGYQSIITTYIDLKELYNQRVRESFDLGSIGSGRLKIAYDAMYGSGQFIVKDLLPKASMFRCEWLFDFNGLSPEPILKNLGEFQDYLKQNPGHDFALVNDGDADRIGLLDGEGHFIDSHHIMLLLLHYLYKYKGMRGKVATGFSSTVKITKYCQLHNLELQIVPIGFKHICELMVNEDILMGGEESGGIAVAGHIPERDGIWNGLVLLQFMQETGKSLQELILEIKNLVGDFAYKRIDLSLQQEVKERIVESCKSGSFKSFSGMTVTRTDTLDGFKYYFNDDEWLLIRPSGTEPVLRTYAEGLSEKRVDEILKACHNEILS